MIKVPSHTQIPNSFLDNMRNYSGAETKVFNAICRKTIGWHKLSDRISYSQLKELTGLSTNGIKKAIILLVAKNIIKQEATKYGFKYDLNIESQGVSVSDTAVSESDTPLSVSDTDPVSVSDSTKESLKETSEKETNNKHNGFFKFWSLYDKKIDRSKCEIKWKRISEKDKADILESIPKYIKATPDKKYRKHPATFLNNRSWENEVIVSEKDKPIMHGGKEYVSRVSAV